MKEFYADFFFFFQGKEFFFKGVAHRKQKCNCRKYVHTFP